MGITRKRVSSSAVGTERKAEDSFRTPPSTLVSQKPWQWTTTCTCDRTGMQRVPWFFVWTSISVEAVPLVHGGSPNSGE